MRMFARAGPARRTATVVVIGAATLVGVGVLAWRASAGDPTFLASVRRGDLVLRLHESGVIYPARSVTYRSPLVGREAEVLFLAPEGSRVNAGDLVARIDTTGVDLEIDRLRLAVRQAEAEVNLARMERDEVVGTLESLSHGDKALELEEARANLALSMRKVERLRQEYEGLKPLLEKGYITRDELERAALELEQAEVQIGIAKRRTTMTSERTRPREERRAQLQLAQRTAQLEQAEQRLGEVRTQLQALELAKEACSIEAARGGLVVYEEHLAASRRRKVRVGDRVTATQGLVTIPEVDRLRVEASVRESDVHRITPGQPTTIRVDAYPELSLSGRVTSVGTLARTSADHSFEDKRFDLLVDVDPTTADLRPEMTARVEILTTERRHVLLVPLAAVLESPSGPAVQLVRGRSRQLRPVELGLSNDDEIEVVAGLEEGDRVALEGPARAPVRGQAAAPASTTGSTFGRPPER
jgi:HlyD family secretion protein